MAAAIEEDREAFGTQKQAQAAERKSWQKEQREALDEMLPKATGRWLHVPIPIKAETCMAKCQDMHSSLLQCVYERAVRHGPSVHVSVRPW